MSRSLSLAHATLPTSQLYRHLMDLSHARWNLRWYKRKPVDETIFNEGNTAATYNEQRLFLNAKMHGSTRLLGGSTFGGTNQIYAHKRGDHQAEMS